MSETTASHVLRIIDVLQAARVEAWLGGGWGIDALVGRQTRPHGDVDLAVDIRNVDVALEELQSIGFVVTTDWLPVRVELTHAEGSRVDIHPLAFDEGGNGIQAGLDGATFEYPAADLVTGVVAGRQVRCISARLQMVFHGGYEPAETDRRDVRTLASATGEPPPEEYV